jgi:hypothetical protein
MEEIKVGKTNKRMVRPDMEELQLPRISNEISVNTKVR